MSKECLIVGFVPPLRGNLHCSPSSHSLARLFILTTAIW